MILLLAWMMDKYIYIAIAVIYLVSFIAVVGYGICAYISHRRTKAKNQFENEKLLCEFANFLDEVNPADFVQIT